MARRSSRPSATRTHAWAYNERVANSEHADVKVVDRRWWARGESTESSAEETRERKPTVVEDLEQRLTESQERSLVRLVRYLLRRYSIPWQNVTAHRFTSANTSCPDSLWRTREELESWKQKHLR